LVFFTVILPHDGYVSPALKFISKSFDRRRHKCPSQAGRTSYSIRLYRSMLSTLMNPLYRYILMWPSFDHLPAISPFNVQLLCYNCNCRW